MPSDLAPRLASLFEAERTVRRLHAELLRGDHAALAAALERAAKEAAGLPDAPEANVRLVRVAELLAEVEGARSVDVLVDIMGSDHPEARLSAGEALEERGYSRFKELALGVERALERLPPSSPALVELPYLLAEIPEPGVMKLLGMFLKQKEPGPVAAAIEALVEVGDPAAKRLLEPLCADERHVSMEDEGGDEGHVAIGELATEAVEMLERGGRP